MAKKKTHGGKRKGAGRKPVESGDKAVVVAVSMSSELVAQLDELREKRGWNRSQAVTEAVRELVQKS